MPDVEPLDVGAPEQIAEPRTKQVREEVKISPTGGKVAGVIQRLSLKSSARSFGLLTLVVAVLGLMFASPAFANQGETGAEYSDGISGIFRFEVVKI